MIFYVIGMMCSLTVAVVAVLYSAEQCCPTWVVVWWQELGQAVFFVSVGGNDVLDRFLHPLNAAPVPIFVAEMVTGYVRFIEVTRIPPPLSTRSLCGICTRNSELLIYDHRRCPFQTAHS